MTDKETLLKSLSNEPMAVIQTAYLYAQNLHLYGVDVTKEWLTATVQSANLEQAHRKGFYDALEKMKEDLHDNRRGD